MLASKGIVLCAFAILICLFEFSKAIVISNQEWEDYKRQYGKDYTNSVTSEAYARYYYAYNRKLIDAHNANFERNQRTFRLRVNQFTDMRLVSFNALFPQTTQPTQNTAAPLPVVVPNPNDNFSPITDLGFQLNIEDQGTVCNSGWAYATAKSIELMNAYQTGVTNPISLSAQQLIDCAGRSRGCTNQVPQTAFDFLTVVQQALYGTDLYPNDNTLAQQGMCLQRPTPALVTLTNYARINDNDDTTLRRMVPSYPVVIEFNPTSFEFMHYSDGIFQQPATRRGSHFMPVIGYGRDVEQNLNYFILQNSFNTTWGENGLIRIAYSTARPLAKSAILPID